MKRGICLLLTLGLLLTLPCLGESEYSFLQMTGLDEMLSRLEAGETVESLSYYDRAYGFNGDFITDDAGDITCLMETLQEMEIAGPSDIFITDWYPMLVFMLSDGSQYVLSFDWYSLEIGSQYYKLTGDEDFWRTISELKVKYAAK